MSQPEKQPIFSTALLIGGAAVGAGILGLPVQTGLAGFFPAALGLFALAVAMLASAWILAWGLIKNQEKKWDLAKLIESRLGPWGKWFLTAGYLVNYYGILVTYLAGAATVLSSLSGTHEARNLWLLAFFIPATGLALLGLDKVRQGNAVFMWLMAASFAVLLYACLDNMEPSRFDFTDWHYLPATLPLIMTSLAFHNMVPATCKSLAYKRRPVFISLALGTCIPLVLGIIWLAAVTGSLPVADGTTESLLYAFEHDQPATLPLARALNSPLVTTAGLAFSICAIFTSYLAVGTGLMGFWRDLLPKKNQKRALRAVITFLPSFAVALIWPDLFLVALNLAGGLGVAVAFGAAPALALMTVRDIRPIVRWGGGLALLALFAGIIILELCTEVGLLHINPMVENWTNYQ